MKQKDKLYLFCLCMGMMFVLLAGCGKGQTPVISEPADVPEVPKPEPEAAEPVDPEPIYPYWYPLTGVGTEEKITTRPIVVMVENSSRARPQSGLDQADIVFEVLAEGAITRFVAVFQSESPEVIGPVRSIRPYFVEIGDELDGLIVHAGWSQAAMNLMVQRGVQHFDAVYGDHPYYWRSDERTAPHNLYTSIEKILEGAEDKRFRTDDWDDPNIKFAFDDRIAGQESAELDASAEGPDEVSEDASATGGEAVSEPDAAAAEDTEHESGTGKGSNVTIPYIGGYYVAYEYDEESGAYTRLMLGEEHKDKESGNTLIAHNVLIAKTAHRIVDGEGRREVNVRGPGEGYLIQRGQVREITWERVDGIIRAFENGRELPWVPGKTWIHIIPQGSEVTFE